MGDTRMVERYSLAALVAAVALSGCIQRTPPGVRLYTPSDPPRARDQIAVLIGPITSVDGRHVVGLGRVFQLLPGCHLVAIGGRVGQFDHVAGGWAASLPSLLYAFRMRGGYTYTISVEPVNELGRHLSMQADIQALEIDTSGNSDEVPFVRHREQLEQCRRWVPESGGAPEPDPG